MNISIKTGLDESELNKIIHTISKHKNVQEIILFGSRAKGNHQTGSDIDLILKGSVSHSDWLNIMIELDELDLPYQFDLLLWNQISEPNLINHIKRVGISLFKAKL